MKKKSNIIYHQCFAWYQSAADYYFIKSISTDSNSMHDTYEDWLKDTERGIKIARKNGHPVIKAIINPFSFPEWCSKNNRQINGESRSAFAAEFGENTISNK